MTAEDAGRAPQACGHCGRRRQPEGRWYLCAACHATGYCSRAHQRAALPSHRQECEPLQDAREPAAAAATAPPPAETSASAPPPEQEETAPSLGAPTPEEIELLEGAAADRPGLASAAPDLQHRVLRLLGAPGDLLSCRQAAAALRAAVGAHAAETLRAPWWLLDAEARAALPAALAFCHGPALLRTACACRSWRRASEDRAAWRGMRLNFGWGQDAEMRGVLRAMRRIAARAGLDAFPEDAADPELAGFSLPSRMTSPALGPSSPPPSPALGPDALPGSPPSRAPRSPLEAPPSPLRSPLGAPRSLLGAPPSPLRSPLGRLAAATPSPLMLCRHAGLGEAGELWLLQREGDRRHADACRRAACRFLALRPGIVAGRTQGEPLCLKTTHPTGSFFESGERCSKFNQLAASDK